MMGEAPRLFQMYESFSNILRLPAEWSKAAVLRTVVETRVGSNPTHSKLNHLFCGLLTAANVIFVRAGLRYRCTVP